MSSTLSQDHSASWQTGGLRCHSYFMFPGSFSLLWSVHYLLVLQCFTDSNNRTPWTPNKQKAKTRPLQATKFILRPNNDTEARGLAKQILGIQIIVTLPGTTNSKKQLPTLSRQVWFERGIIHTRRNGSLKHLQGFHMKRSYELQRT